MIYAIGTADGEFVKFGITSGRAVDRLQMLQVGCPLDLVVVATCGWYDSDEARIHRFLWSQWVRGEWFRRDDRAELVIRAMIQSDRDGFIGAALARSKHGRLGKALDYCTDIAEQH